jgi:hypothetical protein
MCIAVLTISGFGNRSTGPTGPGTGGGSDSFKPSSVTETAAVPATPVGYRRPEADEPTAAAGTGPAVARLTVDDRL